jgi:hypothetical protein
MVEEITGSDAYAALSDVMGPDFMFANDIMLASGMSAETICSYGAGALPPEIYDIFFIAVQHSEATLPDRVCAQCGFERSAVKRCPLCAPRFNRVQSIMRSQNE